MWHILHKCTVTSEPGEYASIKVEHNGMRLTRMLCVKCREEMFLVGHEPFDQAVPWKPAGFAILNTHKADL